MASRSALSENICASSERIWRCFPVAFSGTSSTKTSVTGLPSGASNGTPCARRRNAPSASFSPLMRPCGIATPWPRPVEPSFSRANRLSNTTLRPMPSRFSNSRPACSNRRFLLDISRSSAMCAGVSSLDTRVIRYESCALVVEFIFVFEDLPVQLVGQQVDGRVQVAVLAFAVQVLAAHVQRHLGLLRQLVPGEDHVRVDHVIEVPLDAADLGFHVTAERWCHFQVVATDAEVHHKAFLWLTGGICSDSRYFAIV